MKKEKNLEKLKIVTNIIIIILLIILIIQRSNILQIGKNSSKKLLNNGELVLSEDGEVAQTVNASNWDTNKVTVTKDADGKEVPVPKGYVGSSVAGENKVNEGYVIYEETTAVTSSNVAVARTSRNQWVWIPVPDSSRIYEEVNGVKKAKLYLYGDSGRAQLENSGIEPAILEESDTTSNLSNAGLTGMTPDKLYQELQQEFDSTMESIEKYGGFYIGRYETGNLSQNKPVVKKMNTDISNQTWYTMYNKIGYLAANENVKTNIVWGCLWDEILQWIVENKAMHYSDFMYNSNSWGNYFESTFTYYNGSSNVTKAINQSVKIPTGSSNYVKVLNIYDLSGNMFEYTLEATNSFCRTIRGGSYASSSQTRPMSLRFTMSEPNVKYENRGCRAYLYIK